MPTPRTALRSGRPFAVAIAGALVVGVALTGCSGSSGAKPRAEHAASSSSSTPSTTPTPLVTLPAPKPKTSNGTVVPPRNAPKAVKPKAAPGDLGALVTTAQASASQVTQLHDIAVSAGHAGTIPAAVIPMTARTVAGTLRTQAGTATKLHPAASTPQALLAAALRGYVPLATSLAAWDAHADKPLPSDFFSRLRTADGRWRSAMRSIGALADRDLLKNTPALLYPR